MPPDQYGDIRRTDRPVTALVDGFGEAAFAEEPGHLGHQVGVDGLFGRGRGDQVVLELVPHDAIPDGQPEREGRQRPAVTAQQVPAPVDLGLAHGHERDVGAAEGGSVEQGVQRRQHRVVGPPVDKERPAGGRRTILDGPEVGVHVGTPEGIDGLLGVSHQHQRRPRVRPVEQCREDLPLDRVGVLELIDQRHPESTPEGGDGTVAARAAERVAELGENVVEAEGPALATPEGNEGRGLLHQQAQEKVRRGRTGLVRDRRQHEVGPPVDQHGGLIQLVGARKQVDRAAVHGGGDEDVGTGVPDQTGRVDIESGVGVGSGGDAQGTEHLLGESVNGGDGGGVELGHGARQPGQLSTVPLPGQQGQQVVVGRRGVTRLQMLDRADHPVPDPGPELVGGGAGEGDDQQLRGGCPVFGDESGGQVGQRVRLAGPGAGLDGHLSAGKGVGQVEPGGGVSRHQCPDARSEGRPFSPLGRRWWTCRWSGAGRWRTARSGP